MSNSQKNQSYHEVEYPVNKYVLADFITSKGFEATFIGETDRDDLNGYHILTKGKRTVKVPRSTTLDKTSVKSVLESGGLEIEEFEGYYLHLKALNLIEKISASIEVPKEVRDISESD